jgi:hypothetical protein
MPDHTDHGAFDEATVTNTPLELEAARFTFAAARIRALAIVELHLLELAVQAPDDDLANQLELRADTVWRDAVALAGEHDPIPISGDEEALI